MLNWPCTAAVPLLYQTVEPNYAQLALYKVQTLQLPSLSVDTAYILSMIIASDLATRILWREMRYSLTRRVLLDFIATLEACFVSWEIITIFMAYGKTLFALFCFVNLVQRAYRTNFYTGVSCPYSHLITYLVTRHDKIYGMPFFELTIRILAQILGGLMAYRLNQSAWNFFLTPIHWYQTYNTSYGNCWTFLNVPTTFGFIIEFVGTFLCSLLGSFLYDFEILPRFPLLGYHGRILAQSFGTLCLVLSAFNFTGGFYHPIMASIRTYGCRGFFRNLTSLDHFTVYWMGSTLGALAAYYAYYMGWKKSYAKRQSDKKIHQMAA